MASRKSPFIICFQKTWLLGTGSTGKSISECFKLLNCSFFSRRPDSITEQEAGAIVDDVVDCIGDCVIIVIGTVFSD